MLCRGDRFTLVGFLGAFLDSMYGAYLVHGRQGFDHLGSAVWAVLNNVVSDLLPLVSTIFYFSKHFITLFSLIKTRLLS